MPQLFSTRLPAPNPQDQGLTPDCLLLSHTTHFAQLFIPASQATPPSTEMYTLHCGSLRGRHFLGFP